MLANPIFRFKYPVLADITAVFICFTEPKGVLAPQFDLVSLVVSAAVIKNDGRLPSVLVPGLDLCVCQVESRGQVHAVLHAEVFLSLKAPLKLVELVVGKGCPCFARFFRAHRRTVSATGDFPVTLFFSPYGRRARRMNCG